MPFHVPTFHSYHLLAPRRREKFELAYESFRPGRCHDVEWGAFEKLVRVFGGDNGDDDGEYFFSVQYEEKRRGLERLPAELMDLILGFLDGESLLGVGCASKGLWNGAIGFILREVKTATGCWAGTPILCVGTMTMVRDAPECLKNDIGGEELSEWVNEAVNGFSGVRCTERWLTLLEGCVQEKDKHEDGQQSTSQKWRLPAPLKMKVEAAIQALRKPQACRLWVLRNLTENRFVRLELIPNLEPASEYSHCIHVENEPKLSLEKILLSWICLSGSPNSRAGRKDKWGRPCTEWMGPKGDWAGHCFDVVPSNRMEPEEEWEDVTRIVVGVEVALGYVGREGV